MQWSSPEAQALSKDKEFIPEVILQGNKCRNPDNDPEGPWCYVEISGNVTVDYCDLELCGKYYEYKSLEVLVLLQNITLLIRDPSPACLSLHLSPRGPVAWSRVDDRDGGQGAFRPWAHQETVLQSSHLRTRREW